jgi:hypothetical protein
LQDHPLLSPFANQVNMHWKETKSSTKTAATEKQTINRATEVWQQEKGRFMKVLHPIGLAAMLLISAVGFAKDAKTYKHAALYQMGTLDKSFRVTTGSDVTVSKTQTDAKLDNGGQGMHLIYTDAGNYRVEAPVNKGWTIAAALAAGMANRVNSDTFHNKWFLDNVQSGTKVLFAAECASASKKHPHDTVRCTFYFPDPDSSDHEYETIGDFTPYMNGDGSNTQQAAASLCGTGKLKPDVEAQLCGGATPTPTPTRAPASGTIASTPTPTRAPASGTIASTPTPTRAPASGTIASAPTSRTSVPARALAPGTIDPATGTVVQ